MAWRAYAYARTWAWLILRYIVVPIVAGVSIVREHIPELIADIRKEWAEVEADRKADRVG